MKLIFEKSVAGRRGVTSEPSGVTAQAEIPRALLRGEAAELPELSELDVVRHFTELSRRNFGVDSGFYPLGSCTMKYNPKVAEEIAAYPGFADLHPLLPQLPGGEILVQGALKVLFECGRLLSEAPCAAHQAAGSTLLPAARVKSPGQPEKPAPNGRIDG